MAELERSALEAKDRDELVAIATALGGKPASRAKKADIVSLILDLTGVTSTPDVDPEPEVASGPASDVEEMTPADDGDASSVDEAPAVADAAPSRRPARSRRGRGGAAATAVDEVSETATEVTVEHADDGADEATPNRSGRGSEREGRGDERPSDEQGSDDRARDDRPRPEERSEVDGEQGEGGGRRRRRRGRDRGDRPAGASGERPDEPFNGDPVEVEGILDLRDEGYGFIRVKGYLPSRDDVYVSVKQTRQFSLRRGDLIAGASRPASRNEKNPALLRIDSVNGVDPEQARARRRFEDLTPLFPDERLHLSNRDEPYNMTARIIDLVAPIGKGQRGLIVSPPKAGKTTIMKQIAASIEKNDPDVHVIVLLVDERPEEVTDMRRSVNGDVVASTFDHPAEEHTAIAELVIERAKRLVEDGRDVVVILDGITRLARAYNLAAPQGGRVMSGGIDTGALYPPKKFFGAARNVEEGGSLTILASALVETGSKMDEVIFEEFKGTGNMELRLDRRLAERRVYPAIDVDASSTRHEELLFDRKQLQLIWKLRRVLSGMASDSGSGAAGLEMLVDRLGTFRTNDEFLAEIAKS